jgi:hypothetical protein
MRNPRTRDSQLPRLFLAHSCGELESQWRECSSVCCKARPSRTQPLRLAAAPSRRAVPLLRPQPLPRRLPTAYAWFHCAHRSSDTRDLASCGERDGDGFRTDAYGRRETSATFVALVEPGTTLFGEHTGESFEIEIHQAIGNAINAHREVVAAALCECFQGTRGRECVRGVLEAHRRHRERVCLRHRSSRSHRSARSAHVPFAARRV